MSSTKTNSITFVSSATVARLLSGSTNIMQILSNEVSKSIRVLSTSARDYNSVIKLLPLSTWTVCVCASNSITFNSVIIRAQPACGAWPKYSKNREKETKNDRRSEKERARECECEMTKRIEYVCDNT